MKPATKYPSRLPRLTVLHEHPDFSVLQFGDEIHFEACSDYCDEIIFVEGRNSRGESLNLKVNYPMKTRCEIRIPIYDSAVRLSFLINSTRFEFIVTLEHNDEKDSSRRVLE